MLNISVAFFNVRSLTCNFVKFKDILNAERYDVVGVVETRLDARMLSVNLNISGYDLVRIDRNSRGGGVAAYVSNKLKYINLGGSCADDLEQLWIKVYLSKCTCIIGTLYRPPRTLKENYSNFLNFFEDNVSNFVISCNKFICGGDINIDLLNTENKYTIQFLDALDSFGLKQIINSATRVDRQSATLLDALIISSDLEPIDFGVKYPDVTDHLLVFCRFKQPKSDANSLKFTFRNFKRLDKDWLMELLLVTPFDLILYIENIDEKVAAFSGLLIDLFDTVCPYKTITFKKKKPPWITDTIILMITLRDKSFKKYKNSKNLQDWNYYKTLRNQINIAIRNEKRAYLQETINNNRSQKELWQKFRDLEIYSRNKKTIIPESLNNAQLINDYFLQHSGIETSSNLELIHFYKNHRVKNFNALFEFSLVDEDIIYKYLLDIKSEAIGIDDVSIKMILLCCPYILPIITNIINSCLLSNTFPDEWKISKVLPMPKKSHPLELSDLRPISILPTLSKCLEKIMNAQIKVYLDRNVLLPKRQSGFRQGYSCTTSLLDVVDDVLRMTDIGKTTVLVLLDYTKAFDTISHKLLLAILSYTGFSADAVAMIHSYLSNRYQIVHTENRQSTKNKILRGVPQGTILGPLLFNIYAAQVSKEVVTSKTYFYADDTQLSYSFYPNDIDNANKVLNSDIDKLVKASSKHDLIINPNKSSVLIFGYKRQEVQSKLKIMVDNKELSAVSCAKNLGVELDVDLRFKKHTAKLLQRAYCNLKMLYPHRKILDIPTKIKITDTLVLSHFNYCDVLYGTCLDVRDTARIEKVQKSCLRYIYGIRKYDRISHKLKEAKWMNMATRRRLHSLTLFHSIIINKSPPYLYEKIQFRTDIHNLNLRHRGLISPTPHRSALFERSFTFNIYSMYNNLDVKCKNSSLGEFKIKARKILSEY